MCVCNAPSHKFNLSSKSEILFTYNYFPNSRETMHVYIRLRWHFRDYLVDFAKPIHVTTVRVFTN